MYIINTNPESQSRYTIIAINFNVNEFTILNNNSAIYDPIGTTTITINSKCIFNDLSVFAGNYGGQPVIINGDVVLNDYSFIYGDSTATINGNVIINNHAYIASAIINGNIIFNDSSYIADVNSTITGTITMSLNSANATIMTNVGNYFAQGITFKYEKGINGSSILGIV
jgi:carbonic anhydrase/acetyltransferase-like protein (isoleucine patch superfamily)